MAGRRPFWEALGRRVMSRKMWRHLTPAASYTEMSDMKTEIDYLNRFGLSAGVLAIILAIYNLLLISSRIFVNKIYTNAYPQDFLAFLDCIYRVHSGQIVHRDFSSVIGPFNFALPAIFMSLERWTN